MTRRTLLGALKCAFRDLRRELATDDWTLVIFAVDVAGCRVSRQSSCRNRKQNWSCEIVLGQDRFASPSVGAIVLPERRKVRPMQAANARVGMVEDRRDVSTSSTRRR